jgi:putative redox protein
MDAHVVWRQELAFTGSADSGVQVALGASQVVGGDNAGARPLELVLMGLAGCTAMDVISILQKKRQAVTAFEVRAHADRAADHPQVFTHVELEYVITGRNMDRTAAERAV